MTLGPSSPSCYTKDYKTIKDTYYSRASIQGALLTTALRSVSSPKMPSTITTIPTEIQKPIFNHLFSEYVLHNDVSIFCAMRSSRLLKHQMLKHLDPAGEKCLEYEYLNWRLDPESAKKGLIQNVIPVRHFTKNMWEGHFLHRSESPWWDELDSQQEAAEARKA